MFRIILRLLGVRDFEVCQSCETLKEQLRFVNDEKRQLTETLLRIVSPAVVQAAPVEIEPITTSSTLFSKRRAALEARDRESARTLVNSKVLGRPDNSKEDINHNVQLTGDINKLEKELDIPIAEGE